MVSRIDVFEMPCEQSEQSGGYQVRILFANTVEGEKVRWLTTYREENQVRLFKSLDAVWSFLKPLGAKEFHVYDKEHIANG